MAERSPFGTCAYCGGRIIWVRTKAGRNMPVDPELISYAKPKDGQKATEKIVTPEGEVVSANKVENKKAEGVGYISHFATCPGAGKRRK